MLTASYDGTVKVWDASSGQELLTLKGHDGAVNGLALDSTGERLISVGQDGLARGWLAPVNQK